MVSCTCTTPISLLANSKSFFPVSDYLQELLLSKGACEALLECVREYLNTDTRDSTCVEYGCRALRAVLRYQ